MARAADPKLAAHCRQLAGRLAGHLRSQRLVQSSQQLCALPADLAPVLAGHRLHLAARQRARRAALRWEAALHTAVACIGARLTADAALQGPAADHVRWRMRRRPGTAAPERHGR